MKDNNMLAILFAMNIGSGETFSMSRAVDTDDLPTIFAHLKQEAHVSSENIDTILLVQNGENGQHPRVVKHWSAVNGNFEGL